jgi:glycosidase
VYYGDEVGLTGGEDPDNRRPFPWADEGGQPDTAMLAEFRRLIALRHAQPILRRGILGVPLHVDAHVVALPRRLDGRFAITASNNADAPRRVSIALPADAPARFVDPLDGSEWRALEGRLEVTLPARFGRVLLGP